MVNELLIQPSSRVLIDPCIIKIPEPEIPVVPEGPYNVFFWTRTGANQSNRQAVYAAPLDGNGEPDFANRWTIISPSTTGLSIDSDPTFCPFYQFLYMKRGNGYRKIRANGAGGEEGAGFSTIGPGTLIVRQRVVSDYQGGLFVGTVGDFSGLRQWRHNLDQTTSLMFTISNTALVNRWYGAYHEENDDIYICNRSATTASPPSGLFRFKRNATAPGTTLIPSSNLVLFASMALDDENDELFVSRYSNLTVQKRDLNGVLIGTFTNPVPVGRDIVSITVNKFTRRLYAWVQQTDLTYDIYSIDTTNLNATWKLDFEGELTGDSATGGSCFGLVLPQWMP